MSKEEDWQKRDRGERGTRRKKDREKIKIVRVRGKYKEWKCKC